MSGITQLFTIGYAGYDPESFIAQLRDHGVETIVDIRQNPVSRKRGFSKSKLEKFLDGHGIGYVHLRELGVPSELRNSFRNGECDLDEYFAGFAHYLATQESALTTLQMRAAQERCCLLCVESRPDDCHRSIVTEALVSRDERLQVVHI